MDDAPLISISPLERAMQSRLDATKKELVRLQSRREKILQQIELHEALVSKIETDYRSYLEENK